jgi:EAL domain-containing protein (putative c-di-GMP-specific phosphodiesterase class I)
MYRAKAQGPGSARVFDAELHGEALTRLDDEMALRVAIMTGGLRVHYQPIVALPAGETRGVEALVRWERPGVGLVAPDAFIGLAEECGLIGDLGTFVLSTALADVAGWHADGLVGDDFFVSVNISAVQLSRGGLRRTVAEALANWPLNPGQLWLELTETAIAGDPQLAQQEIRALSALGARVAIDDFGVGQSSLEQLVHSLPVDILKVDRIFTGHLTGPRERAVVAAIAPLADALEMTVVAEGVETGDQARELCELGYPLAQGYHFARPIDGDAVRELLAGAPLRS